MTMTIPELRSSAKAIWESALEAARPARCIRDAVRRSPDGFVVCGSEVRVEGRLIVIGAGKAGASMAQAIEGLLGVRISEGLVITKYGHRLPTGKIQIVEAGHPVPDENGERAVGRLRGMLDGVSSRDVVLCLISGGGSALLPCPAPGVTLAEKRAVTSLLLGAGATIRELNAVRKHLSGLKGGQLAQWAAPARVVSLIISDVIGDPLDFIASGPTAPDTSTFPDALDVLEKYDLEAPAGVYRRLEAGARGEIPETPKEGDPVFARVGNYVIANNRLMVDASAHRARELGFNTIVLSSGIEGESGDIGRLFAAVGREISSSGNPIGAPACVLAAGETTVDVRGPGRGGRNLEMALAWALGMQGWNHPACFASIASDGTDGPTDAAGGLVDPTTCRRGRDSSLDAARHLRMNDSLPFLDAVGDAVRTGPTYTNLMDLQILLVG